VQTFALILYLYYLRTILKIYITVYIAVQYIGEEYFVIAFERDMPIILHRSLIEDNAYGIMSSTTNKDGNDIGNK